MPVREVWPHYGLFKVPELITSSRAAQTSVCYPQTHMTYMDSDSR